MKGHNPRPEEAGSAEGLIAEGEVLAPGDRVVYPNQGIYRVTGTEVQEIAGQKLEMVRMQREDDKAAVASVMVPRNKVSSVGLRRVASEEYVEGVFHYLAAQYDDPELDWKIRHRDNADRMITGGVLGVAEVVKGLHSLSRIRPLPTKEREQYDNARHLLVGEIAAALAVAHSLAEDYIDYALMPPAGTKFQLKPPPKPVELPVRLSRRRPAAKSDEDLGLDDLGLDLGELGELGEGAEGEAKGEGEAEGAAEGAPGAPGGGEGEEEAGEAAVKAAAPKPRAEARGKAAAKKAPAPAPARKPEKARAEKKPAKKAAARKPEKKKGGGRR